MFSVYTPQMCSTGVKEKTLTWGNTMVEPRGTAVQCWCRSSTRLSTFLSAAPSLFFFFCTKRLTPTACMRIKISTFSPVFPSTTDELLHGMLLCNLSVQRGIEAKRRPLLWGANTDFFAQSWVCVCVCVFQPTECEQCTCDGDGIARCLVADCAPPPCVNPVYQPGKCCPECKDGEPQNNLKRGREESNVK